MGRCGSGWNSRVHLRLAIRLSCRRQIYYLLRPPVSEQIEVSGEAGRFLFSVNVHVEKQRVHYGADADGNRGVDTTELNYLIEWDSLELSTDDTPDGDRIIFCTLGELNPVEKKEVREEIKKVVDYEVS